VTEPSLPPAQSDIGKLIARLEVVERQLRRRDLLKLGDLADVRVAGAADLASLLFNDAGKFWGPGTPPDDDSGGGAGGGGWLGAYVDSIGSRVSTTVYNLTGNWVLNESSGSDISVGGGNVQCEVAGIYAITATMLLFQAAGAGSFDHARMTFLFNTSHPPLGNEWSPSTSDADLSADGAQLIATIVRPFTVGGSRVDLQFEAKTTNGADYQMNLAGLAIVRIL
jgi:hypothetical protein